VLLVGRTLGASVLAADEGCVSSGAGGEVADGVRVTCSAAFSHSDRGGGGLPIALRRSEWVVETRWVGCCFDSAALSGR
jgi:hypothetical protein